jgi:hypothetical protein
VIAMGDEDCAGEVIGGDLGIEQGVNPFAQLGIVQRRSPWLQGFGCA